ncbi:response regulator [Aerosakkonemataceae cyanobacterium BLCC-F50]|uniref:Response regulator n=1 Tax=Floridaenema flaviceps BLCC-F50 TaxID=3153642 RepID=A0ABV4XXB1_9CYAN
MISCLSPKWILYIDDSTDNCELVKFILTDAGYKVETVQKGTQALEMAKSGNFQLFIIDLYLSDVSGFELIKEIRALDRFTPIVVCSGDVRQSVQDEVMGIGVQAFLEKPLEPDLLTRTIDEILSHHRLLNCVC